MFRRQFLKRCAAASVLGNAGWPFLAADEGRAEVAGEGPDLIVVNAVVYTMDEKKPKVEAFAVWQGRFAAVGSTKEIRALATPRSHAIDAEGMTVVPGFIDAHTHPAESGLAELLEVDCNRKTIAQIQEALRGRAAKLKEGDWLRGFKYDDTKLEDGRPLSRADIDQAVPKHPVRVEHRGGHTCVYNSLAFKLAGIDKNTPDPEGGKLGRDDKGELTGFVAEKADALFDKAGKRVIATAEDRRAAVGVMSELMSAAGITSVHDASAGKEDFVAYQDARSAGSMRFRVYVMANPALFQQLRTAGLRTGFGDDMLRVGGLKLFCDGSASERTMRMSKPYVGRPNDFGILVTTQDKLNDAVLEAHAAGFQVGTHANGDVAIDMVLKAYDLALRAHPRRDPRHRIEHCTLVNPDLLKRIAAQGVIPTPFYTYVYYHGDKWGQYGDERVQWMFAHRSFLEHGIKVAGASDYVPGPFEPLMAIQSMVTRKDYKGRSWGANQKITVDEALRVCTIHGAYASFEEKLKGSIEAGKLADFVVLEQDPHKVEPDKIKDIKVSRTFLGGKMMHPKGK